MRPALLVPFLAAVLLTIPPRTRAADASAAPARGIGVTETDDEVKIDTDALAAAVRKKGYVSGVAAGSLLDKKTGARDLGFGLHIMDFLLAPGWRDDGYEREPKLHGDLPKHYVEGPQICTQAKQLPVRVVRGDGFVALQTHYTYNKPGAGYKAGSTWEQTLVFQPGVRYFLSAEKITSANDVDDLFYRIDMPGHIRHGDGHGPSPFRQVYLSYPVKGLPPAAGAAKEARNQGADAGQGTFIPASEFKENFAPDAKFIYRRDDAALPQRMIRAYQVNLNGNPDKPGPWLAGMTLDPAEVAEAWCHQRGYVCMIEELHRRHVKAGESFGAAYVVGWFDSVPEMNAVYDRYRGKKAIVIEGEKFRLQ